MATNQDLPDGDSAATRLGRGAGRLRRRIRKAQPGAEKAVQAAARAAAPAAGKAMEFVREHEDELKRAGAAGARALARRATPPVLRPVISAMESELGRPDGDTPVDDEDDRNREGEPRPRRTGPKPD